MIDVEKFDSYEAIGVNKELITQRIEGDLNGVELFLVNDFSISNSGLLILDGWSNNQDVLTIIEEDEQTPRTIAYDMVNRKLIFDGQLYQIAHGRERNYGQEIDDIAEHNLEIERMIEELSALHQNDELDPFERHELGMRSFFNIMYEINWGVDHLRNVAESRYLGLRITGSNLLVSTNEYSYEFNFHLLSDGKMIVPMLIDMDSPDYLVLLDEAKEMLEEDYFEQIRTHIISSDRWLLYLNEIEEKNVLKVYDLFDEEVSYDKFVLPEGFVIIETFLHEDHIFNDFADLIRGRLHIILVGEIQGNSKVISLHSEFWSTLFHTEVQREMHTIGTVASSGMLASCRGVLLIGHHDGTLMMYKLEVFQDMETNTYHVDRDATVLRGNERTDISLQQKEDGGAITSILYNRELSHLFGFYDVLEERIYCIWDLRTGEKISWFSTSDFIKEEELLPQNRMRINSEFTYLIIETGGLLTKVYYIVEISSGEILYRYDSNIGIAERVSFGVGQQANEIWLFHEQSLVLEVIDVSNSNIVNRKTVSEIMDRWAAMYSEAFYPYIGSEIIIFTGYMPFIYSFHSSRRIFTGEIAGIRSNGSGIYIGIHSIYIPLTHEGLFEVLNQSPFIGTMTEEDTRVTGFDIFE